MALPTLHRKLFRNDGYGLLLKPEIIMAPVYVDGTNGNDSNEGTTPGTAVKTITKGLEILSSIPTSFMQTSRLYIAGGTYNDNFSVQGMVCDVVLDGPVTLNGYVNITSCSSVGIRQKSSGSFTVVNSTSPDFAFHCAASSYIFANCAVNLTSSNSQGVLVVGDNAYVSFQSNLNITGNDISNGAIVVGICSSLLVDGVTNISGTDITCGIRTYYSSTSIFNGGVSETSGVLYGISCNGSSYCRMSGDIVLYGTTCIEASRNSTVELAGYSNVSLYRTGGGYALHSKESSYIYFDQASNSTLTINLGSSTSGFCFYCYSFGHIRIYTTNVVFSGSCNTNAYVYVHSLLAISQTTNISGSVTGKRFGCGFLSFINTNGGGANRFPGTTAGTIDAASFGYYN